MNKQIAGMMILIILFASCDRRNTMYSSETLLMKYYSPVIIDIKGKVQTALDFQRVKQFVNGYASVMDEAGKWGYIDTYGNMQIQAQFDEAHPFSCNRAVVETEGGLKVIDTQGRFVNLQRKYDRLGLMYTEGLLVFAQRTDNNNEYRVGFFDVYGRIFVEDIPMKMDTYMCTELYVPFHEGYCVVPNDGTTFIVDKHGRVSQYEFSVRYGARISDGLLQASIVCEDGVRKHGFVNADGNWAIPPKFTTSWQFSDGLAFVAKGEMQTEVVCIDKVGNEIFSLSEDLFPYDYKDGLAKVYRNHISYGFIDRNGNIVGTEYRYITGFQNGYAWVWPNNTYSTPNACLINDKGDVVICSGFTPASVMWNDGVNSMYQELEDIYVVSDKMIAYVASQIIVEYRKRFNIRQYDAKSIMRATYFMCKEPNSEYCIFGTPSHVGVCNMRGKITIPNQYEDVGQICPEYFECLDKSDGKWELKDHRNRLVIDGKYSCFHSVIGKTAVVADLRDDYLIDLNSGGKTRQYRELGYYSDSIRLTDGLMYPCDKAGNVLSRKGYYSCIPLHKDLYLVMDKGKAEGSLIDSNGNILMNRVLGGRISKENLIPVCREGKWGFVDVNGIPVLPFAYDDATEFYGDIAIVRIGDREGLIRKNGSWLLKPMRCKFLTRSTISFDKAAGQRLPYEHIPDSMQWCD